MWSTINRLMTRYYQWEKTSMESLDTLDVYTVKEECKQIYEDLKRRLDDKDPMNKVLA